MFGAQNVVRFWVRPTMDGPVKPPWDERRAVRANRVVRNKLKRTTAQTYPFVEAMVLPIGPRPRDASDQRKTSASNRRLAARKMSAKRWDEEIRTRTRRARWTIRAAT